MLKTSTITSGMRKGHIGMLAALLALGGSQVALAAPASDADAQGGACTSPALGFIAGKNLHLSRGLDTRSVGSDRIVLQPYAAPPDDAFLPFEKHPDWGHVAAAAIVTASADEQDYLPIRGKSASTSDCSTRSCECDADEAERVIDYTYKNRSYQELLCCPDFDSDDASCDFVSDSGDSDLKQLDTLRVPALKDYFVIYLEKAAPAGSEFADYMFHSTQGLSAGYHLVHAEVNLRGNASASSDEPYVFTVVDIEQPIPNDFERGAAPTGVNF